MALNLTLAGLVGLAIGAVALGAWEMRRGLPVNSLPSLVWCLMITVPFLAQLPFWKDPQDQTLGILIFGVSILAGDFLATRIALRNSEMGGTAAAAATRDPRAVQALLALLAIVSLAFALWHLYLMPEIPLLQRFAAEGIEAEKYADLVEEVRKLRDAGKSVELANESRKLSEMYWEVAEESRKLSKMREASAKLLPIPKIVMHLFNWVLTVFSTIGIVALLRQRRYILAGPWFALAFLYASLTTAKGPAALLMLGIGGGMIWGFDAHWRRRIYAVGVISLVAFFAIGAVYIVASPSSRLSLLIRPERREMVNWEKVQTLPDLWRARLKEEATGKWIQFLDDSQHPEEYILYRVFLAPVEVAHHWYQYFNTQERQEGWQGILPGRTRRGFIPPARWIGLLAYRARFPNNYGTTVNAYASADADANAHFGIPGIFGAALLLLGFRALLAIWGRGSALRRGISGSGIILLAFLLPMGSLQAIFGAQGIFLYPAALWVAKKLE